MNFSQDPTPGRAEIEALRNDLREARIYADTCRINAERSVADKSKQIDALARVLRQCFTEIEDLKAANAALARAWQARTTPPQSPHRWWLTSASGSKSISARPTHARRCRSAVEACAERVAHGGRRVA